MSSAARKSFSAAEEANGIELADKVQDSANSALERLFPQFSEADHANWGQVVTRARAGDVGALSQVGYPGDVTKHPICRRVLDLIGAGKKGKDVQEHFQSLPAVVISAGAVDIHGTTSVLAAFRAGADGVILSRKYSEMHLSNLGAAGAAIRELRQK